MYSRFSCRIRVCVQTASVSLLPSPFTASQKLTPAGSKYIARAKKLSPRKQTKDSTREDDRGHRPLQGCQISHKGHLWPHGHNNPKSARLHTKIFVHHEDISGSTCINTYNFNLHLRGREWSICSLGDFSLCIELQIFIWRLWRAHSRCQLCGEETILLVYAGNRVFVCLLCHLSDPYANFDLLRYLVAFAVERVELCIEALQNFFSLFEREVLHYDLLTIREEQNVIITWNMRGYFKGMKQTMPCLFRAYRSL
jgi:hypothetical protein